jgi:hypothetical protein
MHALLLPNPRLSVLTCKPTRRYPSKIISAVFQSLGLIPWYGVCLLPINEQLNLERCEGVYLVVVYRIARSWTMNPNVKLD